MISKARVLLILLILGCNLTTFSQIHFGGRVGINMSSLSVQPELEYDRVPERATKVTPNIALLGYFEIGPYFAIQPEFIYNRKGQKLKMNTEIETDGVVKELEGNWNQSFDYFEIPLMFKLSLNSEGFDPFIEFGAYYGHLFNSNYKAELYENDELIIDESYSLDFGGHDNFSYNRTEYGMKVGIGGTLELNRGMAYFSIRYSQGLTDVVDYIEKPLNYDATYNRVFQLTVGYVIELRSNAKGKTYYY